MRIKYNHHANGGTELMARRLESVIDQTLYPSVDVIVSRVNEDLDQSKINILWLHDLADDPQTSHLNNRGWSRFDHLVFVSNHQMQEYIRKYNIPWNHCSVISNAIEEINPKQDWNAPRTKLIYTSTPHRGLDILYYSFDHLSKIYDIELDVYSSFKLYGWEERDKQFEQLFELLRDHEKINYHGSKSNEEVRDALSESHIWCLPSIWPETSCIALIEAMSAGCICIHSNLGALYETASNDTLMYHYIQDKEKHLNRFNVLLEAAINRPIKQFNSNRIPLRYTLDSFNRSWRGLIDSLYINNR